MPRLSPLAVAVVLAVALPACGNERQRAPATPQPAPATGKQAVDLPRWGVAFVRPASWQLAEPPAPQIASVSSGPAAISFWSYRRQERLPRSDGDLQRARRALVAAARARDRSLRVLGSRALRLAGVPGVEVLATQRMGLVRRRVRSTHLYAHGRELVVDAYAPPADFARVDRTVFVPLLRSLRVRRPAARRRP